jgi:hypothetical protein
LAKIEENCYHNIAPMLGGKNVSVIKRASLGQAFFQLRSFLINGLRDVAVIVDLRLYVVLACVSLSAMVARFFLVQHTKKCSKCTKINKLAPQYA